MNKKKALFTSLAALALASTAQVGFAEEVDATVAEPTVAEVPVTEEVAQDAPVAEVVTEEAPVETAPEVTTRAVEEEVQATTFAAASAGEQATVETTLNIQEIKAENFSSAAGEWTSSEGEVVTITTDGIVSENANNGLPGMFGATAGFPNNDEIASVQYIVTADIASGGVSGAGGHNFAAFSPVGTVLSVNYANQTFEYGVDNEKDRVLLVGRGDINTVPKTIYTRPAKLVNQPVAVAETVTEEVVAQPVVEESTPVEIAVSATDAILANDFSPIAGQWATADGKTLEVSSTGTINLSDGRTYTVHGANQGSGSDQIVFNLGPIAGFGIAYYPGIDEITTGSGIWGSVPDVYKRVAQAAAPTTSEVVAQPVVEEVATPETAQPSVEVVEEPATSPVNKPVQTPFSPIAGQWVNGYGDIIEISETGEMYFGGIRISPESFTTQLEVYAGFDNAYLTGVTGVQGISYLADTDQLRLSLPIGWAPLADEEAEKAAREDLTKLTLYSRVTAVNTSPVAEELVAQPVVTETAAPTTSEIVHVSLTAKTEATVEQATPAKPSYSRSEKAQVEKTAQSEKGILPSTGEVTSVLGAIGASLSAFGLAGLRRRK